MAKEKEINMKLLKFIKIPLKEKLMLTEAFLLFLLSYILVTSFPLKFYSKFIGKYMEENNLNDFNNNDTNLVFLSIRRAKKLLPFQPKCLVNSIVTKKMLDKRKIKNMLYLGLNKDNSDKLKAHAWVNVFSTNNKQQATNNKQQYNVIAFFS